jgi:hypothetical protein
MSVSQFANDLKMPATALLEQLQKAGVNKLSDTDMLTERDKSTLLDYLRKSHGKAAPKAKITLAPKKRIFITANSNEPTLLDSVVSVAPVAAADNILGARPQPLPSATALACHFLTRYEPPAQPIRMLSNLPVYCGREDSEAADYARAIVKATNKLMTLRELHEALSARVRKGTIESEFIWKIDLYHAPVERAIHQDSEGCFFVKLEKKWQRVFPIDRVGRLAAPDGQTSSVSLPSTGYFTVHADFRQAVRHSI